MTTVAYGALWIFVFSLPWERILVLTGVSIIPRATGGLAFGLALLAVVISGRFRPWHFFHLAALLFWIWCGVTMLLFHTGGPSLPGKFWTFAQLLLVLWMIWELAPTARHQRGLMTAYVLGGYVAAFDTILLYRKEAGVLRRFAVGGADPNDLAMVLALGLPMAWYLGTTYRKPILKWVCRCYLPVALVAIGLTGSRGGMLATTVALLIVPLSVIKLSPGRLTTAIVVLALCGAAAVAYIPETLIERFSTTGSELEGGRLGGRGKYWEAGWEAFKQRPIMGWGTSAFRKAITPMMGTAAVNVAHNSFLSVAVEEGIIGFLLYMAMMAAVFRSVLTLPKLERRFALVLLATLGAAMLPLTWEDRRVVWVILPVLFGFSQAYLVASGRIGRPPSRAELQPAAPLAGRPVATRGLGRQAVARNDARGSPG
jgi:O-antigen ligase